MKSQVAANISGAAEFLKPQGFFEKVAFARSCGVNAIELHPYQEWPEGGRSLLELEDADREAVRECCLTLDGISVHALMGQTFASDDEELRGEAIAGNLRAIEEAQFMGSRAVVVHCRMSRIAEPVVLDRVIPILKQLADHGEAHNVRVCLETPTDLRDPAQFVGLFEEVDHPWLGATIDTGHLLSCVDEDTKKTPRVVEVYNETLCGLTREIVAMGKLFHVHLNDIRIRGDALPDHYGIGLGFVDFERVLGSVKESGYDGLLALEIHRGPGGEVGSITPDEFREAVDYVKQIVG